MRLIVIITAGVITATGCKRAPTRDGPVSRDLINARFEEGTKHWKCAFGERAGKAQENEGINNTACIKLPVGPDNQIDCFSQAIESLDASECQASAYVRATGADINARIRLECTDPDQFGNDENYGQLAEVDSQVCPPNGQWTLLSATVTIPKKTKYIRVFASVDGTDGAAWFDDFQVSRR